MIRIIKPYYFISILIIFSSVTNAQEYDLRGMATGWLSLNNSQEWVFQSGGRYLPEFGYSIPLNDEIKLEGEISANLFGSYTSPFEGEKFYGRIKPYRIWTKVSGTQFEIRAGLQKINFGSASVLRPLMWFDRMDPRDPLNLTDGVYGILGRYYTLGNANFWMWALYGNKTKGWETEETKNRNIEAGGRIQFPVPRAEIGISYHHRVVQAEDIISTPAPLFTTYEFDYPENKFGIDIKADLGIGLWIEEVLIYNRTDLRPEYNNMFTAGADYTFGVGNGLRLMAEHLIVQYSGQSSGSGQAVQFTSFSASYPLSVFADINYISYFDWKNKLSYRFVRLGLTYDRFSYYIMGFINPSEYKIFNFEASRSVFSGKGIQVMMVFNY